MPQAPAQMQDADMTACPWSPPVLRHVSIRQLAVTAQVVCMPCYSICWESQQVTSQVLDADRVLALDHSRHRIGQYAASKSLDASYSMSQVS